MRILCIKPLMVNFSNVDSFDKNPRFKISPVGTPASLAFELEAVLVDHNPS